MIGLWRANDLAVVILAAGKGTRLKSSVAKVLHRAGGRSLVEHVVTACAPLKSRKIIAVIGHQAEQVSAIIAPREVESVVQQPAARHRPCHCKSRAGAVGKAKIALVLPGDAPLIRTETLRSMIAAHRAANAAVTILTAVVSDPSGYGRILRKSETSVQPSLRNRSSPMSSATSTKSIPASTASRWKNSGRRFCPK